MANVNHLITLGIGTPGDIAHFVLVGLSPAEVGGEVGGGGGGGGPFWHHPPRVEPHLPLARPSARIGALDWRLPALTAQLRGAVGVRGVVTSALPVIAGRAAGLVPVMGCVQAALPGVAAAMCGAARVHGGVHGRLPDLTAHLAADYWACGDDDLMLLLATLLIDEAP